MELQYFQFVPGSFFAMHFKVIRIQRWLVRREGDGLSGPPSPPKIRAFQKNDKAAMAKESIVKWFSL